MVDQPEVIASTPPPPAAMEKAPPAPRRASGMKRPFRLSKSEVRRKLYFLESRSGPLVD